MRTFIRSLTGGVQRLFGASPGGTSARVPRWTAAELGILSLAGVLLLIGVLLIATGGNRATPGASAPDANVTAIKTGNPNPVVAGQPLDFTIVFQTDTTITGFSIDDPIPANTTYLSSDINNLGAMNCGISGNILQCRNGSLQAFQNGSVTVHLKVDVNAPNGTLTNTAAYVWAGGVQQSVSGSVTVLALTPTPTNTDTPTVTPTETPTGTATNTPSETPTSPPVPTNTPPGGPSPTPPPSNTPGTVGPTTQPSATPRVTNTVIVPDTFTPVPSATPGTPPPPTDTPTQVPPSNTPGGPTVTPVGGTNTPTDTPTDTPTPRVPPPPGNTNTPGPGGTTTPGAGGTTTPGAGGTTTPGTGCGDITGTLRIGSGPAAGVTAELRSKTNDGIDTFITSTQTDANGIYHFRGIASSPANASYYIRYPGGMAGTVAIWYGPGFTYAACATQQMVIIDIADAPFTSSCNGGAVTLPSIITWAKRNTTDLYRLYIYSGNTVVIDSGELNNASTYTVAAGAVVTGTYTAMLTIRDPNTGNGQASTACAFSIGVTDATATPGGPTTTPVPPPPPPPASPTTGISGTVVPLGTSTPVPASGPDIRLLLTVDQAAAYPGETLDYTLVIFNAGKAAATHGVVTDLLPDGLLLDPDNAVTTRGTLKRDNNTISVSLDSIAPSDRITVTIKASVIAPVNTVLANSASITYDQSPAPVKSNTVQTLVVGLGTPKPSISPTAGVNAKTPVAVPTTRTGGTGGTGTTGTTGTGTTTPIPTTGGEFPLFTGLILSLAAVLLRQLRLRRQATAGD